MKWIAENIVLIWLLPVVMQLVLPLLLALAHGFKEVGRLFFWRRPKQAAEAESHYSETPLQAPAN